MADEPGGGVFIPTEKIYDLLVESISQTNERLTEIRTDIRSMADAQKADKDVLSDHEKRMRKMEETLNKLPWTNIAAILGAVSGLILAYMKVMGK